MDNTTKEYKITAKQDKFAYYLAKGLSQREAYRKAYPNTKMSDKTVDEKACRNKKIKKIQLAYERYSEELKASEEKNLEERTIVIDESVYEAIIANMDGYATIKEFIQESSVRNLPENYENIDDWLRRNKRKNITESVRYEVFARANFRCEACGNSPKIDNECVLHVDHIIPFSLGGIDNMTNYQCLCGSCNTSKGNRYSINNRKEYINI